jgi:hypothetical protein
MKEPMAAVGEHISAFNRGDRAAMAAACAEPGVILDGMAPHVWQGPTATQDWYRDALLGEPLHDRVTGQSAHVVVPAALTFNLRGQRVTQIGAVFTVALRKLAQGRRIAPWVWAKGRQ